MSQESGLRYSTRSRRRSIRRAVAPVVEALEDRRLLTATPVAAASPRFSWTYFNDFDGPAEIDAPVVGPDIRGNEDSPAKDDLGYWGTSAVATSFMHGGTTITLSNIPDHQLATVSFTVYVMGYNRLVHSEYSTSVAGSGGPDLTVTAAGVDVFSHSFDWGSIGGDPYYYAPDGYAEPTYGSEAFLKLQRITDFGGVVPVGEQYGIDGKALHPDDPPDPNNPIGAGSEWSVTFTVPSTDSTFELKVSSKLNGASRLGIDNVSIVLQGVAQCCCGSTPDGQPLAGASIDNGYAFQANGALGGPGEGTDGNYFTGGANLLQLGGWDNGIDRDDPFSGTQYAGDGIFAVYDGQGGPYIFRRVEGSIGYQVDDPSTPWATGLARAVGDLAGGTTSPYETQTLTVKAPATAGTFKLSYNGNTTAALAFNAATADVQSALRLLPGLSSVVVSGSPLTTTDGMMFTFAGGGNLIAIDSAAMTPDTGFEINTNGHALTLVSNEPSSTYLDVDSVAVNQGDNNGQNIITTKGTVDDDFRTCQFFLRCPRIGDKFNVMVEVARKGDDGQWTTVDTKREFRIDKRGPRPMLEAIAALLPGTVTVSDGAITVTWDTTKATWSVGNDQSIDPLSPRNGGENTQLLTTKVTSPENGTAPQSIDFSGNEILMGDLLTVYQYRYVLVGHPTSSMQLLHDTYHHEFILVDDDGTRTYYYDRQYDPDGDGPNARPGAWFGKFDKTVEPDGSELVAVRSADESGTLQSEDYYLPGATQPIERTRYQGGLPRAKSQVSWSDPNADPEHVDPSTSVETDDFSPPTLPGLTGVRSSGSTTHYTGSTSWSEDTNQLTSSYSTDAFTVTSIKKPTYEMVIRALDNHYSSGEVMLVGAYPTAYNGVWTVSRQSTNHVALVFTGDTIPQESASPDTANNNSTMVLVGLTQADANQHLVDTLSYDDGETPHATATFTGNVIGAYQVGDIIRIAGATPSEYNGEFYITNVSDHSVEFTLWSTPSSDEAHVAVDGTSIVAVNSNRVNTDAAPVSTRLVSYNGSCWFGVDTIATISASAAAFLSSSSVTIVGAAQAAYNGTFPTCGRTATTLSIDLKQVARVADNASPQSGSDRIAIVGNTTNSDGLDLIQAIQHDGRTATITFSSPHSFAVGDTIRITGAAPVEYNGCFLVTAADNSSVSFTLGTTPSADATPAGNNLRIAVTNESAFAGRTRLELTSSTIEQLVHDGIINSASDLESWSPWRLAQYADSLFRYNSESGALTQTVNKQTAGVPDSTARTYSGKADGTDTWDYQETTLNVDGSQSTTYYNYKGDPMLTVGSPAGASAPRRTGYIYDADGNQLLEIENSAFNSAASINESLDDLGLNGISGLLLANGGLIHVTTYYQSTTATDTVPGGVKGRVQSTAVRHGFAGSNIITQETTYLTRTVAALTSVVAITTPNASFETPVLASGTSQTTPGDADWSFYGNSGITFPSGVQPTDGTQAAFLQGTAGAYFEQPLTLAGSSQLSIQFTAAQRTSGSNVTYTVYLDGTSIGQFTPTGTSFAAFTINNVYATGACNTLRFQASAGGDEVYIDAIKVVASGTVPCVTGSETVYAGTNHDQPRTTQYKYTWYANSTQIASATTIHPAVTTSQNGSGISAVETVFYDIMGRERYAKDADGYIRYSEYDRYTGSLVRSTTDADTSSVVVDTLTPTGVQNGATYSVTITPQGASPIAIQYTAGAGATASSVVAGLLAAWTAAAGSASSGLVLGGDNALVIAAADATTGFSIGYLSSNLDRGLAASSDQPLSISTTQEVDYQGQVTVQTDANGVSTYTIYKHTSSFAGAQPEIWVYPAWDPVAHKTTGPIQVSRTVYSQDIGQGANARGSYTETLTFLPSSIAVNPSTNLPTGNDPIYLSDVRSLSRSIYNSKDQLIAQRSYFRIPSTGNISDFALGTSSNGSSTGNYHETLYGYDSLGRQDRVTSPTGTLTRTAFDNSGRELSTWVGTRDFAFTVSGTAVDHSGGSDDQTLTRSVVTAGTLTSAQVDEFTPDNVEVGDVFTLTATLPNGSTTLISFTATEASAASVCAGLVTAWNNSTASRVTGVTATNTGTAVRLTAQPNIVKVSENEYDNGGVGDSLVTRQTVFPTGSTNPRSTLYFYDWRDRLVATEAGTSPGATAVGTDANTYTAYDNLDEVTAQYAFGAKAALNVANASFESPVLASGTYQYNPANSGWSYSSAGITHATGLQPADGAQAAFLMGYSGAYFQQSITVPNGSVLSSIQFAAAQKTAGSNVTFTVYLDGTSIGQFTPTGTSFTFFTIDSLSKSAGTHTLKFQASAGGDQAYIDAVKVFAFLSSGLVDANSDGTPDLPAAAFIRAETTTEYDNLGRSFATHVFSVDPSTGALSTHSANTLVWYDQRGNGIKSSSPGGLVTKNQYDGAGRLTATYTSDGGGDAPTGNSNTWSDANSLTDDIVMEQSEYKYDLDGNVIFTITRQRYNDTTATGPLGNPGSNPTGTALARVYYSEAFYDAANRVTASLDLGTNNGIIQAARHPVVPTRSTIISGSTSDSGTNTSSTSTLIVGSTALSSTPNTYIGYTVKLTSGPMAGKFATVIGYDSATSTLTVAPAFTAIVGTGTYFQIYFDAQITTYSYSTNSVTVTDPRGNNTQTYWDALGRTTSVWAPNPGNSTYYTYDAAGHITTQTNNTFPYEQTQYVYGVSGPYISSNDLLAETRYPDKSTGNASSAPADKEVYTYDALGEVLTKTDENQTVHTYAYDILGRVTSDTATVASGNPKNIDTTVASQGFTYNSQGQLDTATSYTAGGASIVNQVRRVYNGLGQLIAEYQSASGAVTASTPAVTYTYLSLDAQGNTTGSTRLLAMTYPNGRQTLYEYGDMPGDLNDRISRLTGLAEPNVQRDGLNELEQYAYLGLGTVVQRVRPAGNSQLSYIGTSYGAAGDKYTGLDRFGRIVDQYWSSLDSTPTTQDRFQYGYDSNGNVIYKKNVLAASHSEAYSSNGLSSFNQSYDALNRLTRFQRGTLYDNNNDGIPDYIYSTQTQTFDMDWLGNIRSDGGATRTYNARNQMVTNGTATLTYDDDGNTSNDGAGNLYVYDAWNHLVTVKNSTDSSVRSAYTTDALGRRITETPTGQSTTTHVYSSQWQVLEDDASSGVAKAQYVWSPFYVDDMILRDRDANTSNVDGGLDATFNTGGKVQTDINGGSYDSGNAVVILPSGKTLVAGSSNGDFAIVRYNADGTVDTTFNSTGRKIVDIGSGTIDAAYAMAVQSDGKIVVAGSSNGDFAVIRLNANGTLDTSFDGDGKQTIDINSGTSDVAYTVALVPGGDMYLAGVGRDSVTGTNTGAIVRLDSSGALVNTFNSTGKKTFHTNSYSNSEEIRAAVVSPAGELYVTGSDLAAGKYFLARVTAAGQLDTTFNTNGYVSQYPATNWTGQAYAITLQSDGKVVVAGTASNQSTGVSSMFAMRFLHQTSNGQILDSTFNGGAAAIVTFSLPAAAYAVAADNTGEIYLAGQTSYTCGASFAVARLTSTGAIDNRFDADGRLTTSFSTLGYSYINGAAITPDGKFAAAGTAVSYDCGSSCCGSSGGGGYDNYDFAVARYLAPSGLEERRFVEQDANHNVTSISDALGNVVERYEYTPYGQRTVLTASWGATTPVANTSAYAWVYGHQGGRLDPTTLDWYFRNRDLWSAAERWTQVDPAGYVDGMNAYGVLQANPLGGADPMGLFASRYHTSLATGAAGAFGMRSFYTKLYVAGDVNSDTLRTQMPDHDFQHAQDTGWAAYVRGIMKQVDDTRKWRGSVLKGRSSSSHQQLKSIVEHMGSAAHALEDYYSHTDWVEGQYMSAAYLAYDDTKMMVAMGAVWTSITFPTAVGPIWAPGGTASWWDLSGAHESHYTETIDMDKLWSGNVARYTNVLYFTGGGVTTAGPTLPSPHEKYSADDGPGKGRDKYIPGSFARTYALASIQAIAFVRWCRDHMHPCLRMIVFGY